MVTQNDYLMAQQYTGLRRTFLDRIDLEEAKPYVRKLVYSDRKLARGLYGPVVASMRTMPPINAMFGFRGGKANVIVYASAFSALCPTVGDFLSAAIDHEGWHARELFEDPEIAYTPLWKQIKPRVKVHFSRDYFLDHWREMGIQYRELEIRAYENQLRNFERRNCSEIFAAHVEQFFVQLKHEITFISRADNDALEKYIDKLYVDKKSI